MLNKTQQGPTTPKPSCEAPVCPNITCAKNVGPAQDLNNQLLFNIPRLCLDEILHDAGRWRNSLFDW